ncbi:hypothetical protein TOPH_05789 [Tolypocladium ophioglossoides CBS 100239]|uniref:Zn(2)-C6 fungal-type domain-containing protein n=1 Tax=Tolypocladium ophioglossoides (strain CBS 100239) TaxID=1163406 RepID=A0A0L0N602_TOLOC|nr:hypothetical protein TOPH_05789 [Tolypocladium ophioglossoides CBS 100239]
MLIGAGLDRGRPDVDGHDVAFQKASRTRTGCLNCRRSKRKCDERRPSCGACCKRSVPCDWRLKLSFRAENARHIDRGHPSMQAAATKRPRQYAILDITSEVIRDYSVSSPPGRDSQGGSGEGRHMGLGRARSAARRSTASSPAHDNGSSRARRVSPGQPLGAMERPFGVDSPSVTTADASPMARRQTENAVASLLSLSRGGQPREMPGSTLRVVSGTMSVEHMDRLRGVADGTSIKAGVFMSNAPAAARRAPLSDADADDATMRDRQDGTLEPGLAPTSVESRLLSSEEECTLWRHWFDQIAPWLDMLDSERHFQHVLPTMVPDHDHLRFSMLALSARHMELKNATLATGRGLALYREASRLLLPRLPSRSTAVIASYVLLCVLEVLSCPPKGWKRHLEDCAGMMEAVGFSGFVGGLRQALFWCFARMDVCGGLASSVATLVPVSRWASASRMNLDDGVRLFRSDRDLTGWANYAVFLTAQVLDLLAPVSDTSLHVSNRADPVFGTRWIRLWKHISDWLESRPAPLCPVMTITSSDSSLFPTIIFSNPAAISGNQLYHTASLLMLQNKPRGVRLSPEPRSILWPARRVCAISISSDHHGAWINGVQSLCIAGRCMSHPAEHKAILELLERIETESGWGTRWQAEDLKTFWGNLGQRYRG